MKQKIVQVHPKDNVLVALQDILKGEEIIFNNNQYVLREVSPRVVLLNQYDFIPWQPGVSL